MKLTGRILVVDDDQVIRDFFQNTLSQLGFTVFVCEDGLDGLEKLEETEIDLVLLDNIMPRLTGYEFIQILKKDPDYKDYRNLPIIMFSAMDDTESKVIGFEMGIDDYITKPFNFTEVLARIRSIFRHKEISEQLNNRDKRLAILESLNTNLFAVKNHIITPFTNLYSKSLELDFKDIDQIKDFVNVFKKDYDELQATLKAIESEIDELNKKGKAIKMKEISLEDLEKKISINLDHAQ